MYRKGAGILGILWSCRYEQCLWSRVHF